MNKRGIAAGVVCLVVVAGVFAVAQYWPHTATSAQQVGAVESYWHKRILRVGPVSAYAELAASVREATPEKEHEAAHAFGGALYDTEGKGGLSVCDARFNFGCYHEFLGKAIAAEGLAAAVALNERCFSALTESPLSCQHGIGHGILAYLGYAEKNLLRGLGECEKIPYADPIGGCYGGLFMEYNLQTMLAEQARARPLGADPLLPCSQLKDAYKPACYYWQPQWWAQVLRPALAGERAFLRMGAWCQETGAHRRDCFEGIGNIAAPESQFDADTARRLCEVSSVQPADQLHCKSIAANSLALGGAGQKGDGLRVCQGLVAREYDYCAAYARNEANQVQRAQLEQ